MQSRKFALRSIEVTNTEGHVMLTVAPDRSPPYFKRRWAELVHEALEPFEAWCPACENNVVWLREATSGRAAGMGAKCVACWMRCFDCKAWILLEDEEIFGTKVLNPQECEVAKVMEE